MRANELRIGNRIEFFNGVSKPEIMSINARFFSSLASGRPTAELRDNEELNGYYRPIEITADWLSKLGFKKVESFRWEKTIQIKGCQSDDHKLIAIGTNRISVSFLSNQFWSSTQCESLHQLQNLYFAITGHELLIP